MAPVVSNSTIFAGMVRLERYQMKATWPPLRQ
jgi:hypothetical protein